MKFINCFTITLIALAYGELLPEEPQCNGTECEENLRYLKKKSSKGAFYGQLAEAGIEAIGDYFEGLEETPTPQNVIMTLKPDGDDYAACAGVYVAL